jgi:phosphatidate cytidylyltransferase
MIVLLVVGLIADQWLDTRALPDWLATPERPTFPPGTVLLPIVLVLVGLAARELAVLLESEGIEGSKRAIVTAAIVGVLVSCLVPSTMSVVNAVAVVSTVSIVMLVVAMAFYSRHKSVEGVIAATGGVLLGYVYLGLMAGFLLAIRREHEVWILGWIILIVKACDIGAYFTGKAIGTHKLIPWLSPGKTWEGLWGGVALSVVVSLLGLWMIDARTDYRVPGLLWGVALGVVLAITGQVGDLLESLLKRDAGKKDSGHSIPGFGGVLDVLDSPLLAAPVAFWWLRAMEAQGYFRIGG